MQKNGEQAQYLLQSVDNALCVLNLFDNTDKLSLTEIAAQMGMGKTTALRLRCPAHDTQRKIMDAKCSTLRACSA